MTRDRFLPIVLFLQSQVEMSFFDPLGTLEVVVVRLRLLAALGVAGARVFVLVV